MLRDVEQLLDEVLTESRSLAAELSPPVLRDAGLAAAFEWLTRRMERDHGLVIALDADEAAEPERPEIRTLLFEATRELLFNVVKHSGVNAGRLTLWVTPTPRWRWPWRTAGAASTWRRTSALRRWTAAWDCSACAIA